MLDTTYGQRYVQEFLKSIFNVSLNFFLWGFAEVRTLTPSPKLYKGRGWYASSVSQNDVLKEQRGTKYGSLHLMLQARIDSAKYINYIILPISTVQVSWSDAIFEMPNDSASKAQYRHLNNIYRQLKNSGSVFPVQFNYIYN
jgi:hypothetical protein